MTPISHQRLDNQQITNQLFSRPEDVVRYMGAMQAQDYEMSKWAVGVRLPQATDQSVEAALNDGRIIRTHIFRPTWHLVAAEDLRWMMDLTARHVMRLNASIDRALGLNEEIFIKANVVIQKALSQHGCLTREEVMVYLSEKGFDTTANRPAHYMFYAELTMLVCSGPKKGKQITYMLADERVPPSPLKSREEGLATLALRYFTSHGPATIKDFSWWSGLNLTDVKTGISACGKSLVSEKINDKEYWMSGQIVAIPQENTFALPAFDEFMVSYADRSLSAHPDTTKQAILGNGIFKPIIVENGEVKGTWKRTVKPQKIDVAIQWVDPHSSADPEVVHKALGRYGQFMKKPLCFE